MLALTGPSRVVAQMRGMAGVSRPMPAPAFVGLQNFLASPTGASLIVSNPALQQILKMDPVLPNSLQALGPLAASLPADFMDRVHAANSPEAEAALGKTFSRAYAASVQGALAEIDALSLAAARAAASDPAKVIALNDASSDLKLYSFYGEAARSRVAVFAERAAAVHTRELAQNLATQLLAKQLRAEARRPGAGGEVVREGPVDEASFARRRARLPKPSLNFFKTNEYDAARGGDSIVTHLEGFHHDGMVGDSMKGGLREGWAETVEFNGQSFPAIPFALASEVKGIHPRVQFRGVQTMIERAINAAKTSIDIDEVTATAPRIRDILLDAQRRGVPVSLIVLDEMARANHSRLFVIDGTQFTGSQNPDTIRPVVPTVKFNGQTFPTIPFERAKFDRDVHPVFLFRLHQGIIERAISAARTSIDVDAASARVPWIRNILQEAQRRGVSVRFIALNKRARSNHSRLFVIDGTQFVGSENPVTTQEGRMAWVLRNLREHFGLGFGRARAEASIKDVMALLPEWAATIALVASQGTGEIEIDAMSVESSMKDALEETLDEVTVSSDFRGLSRDAKIEAILKTYVDKAARSLSKLGDGDGKQLLADPRNKPFMDRLSRWLVDYDIPANWVVVRR